MKVKAMKVVFGLAILAVAGSAFAYRVVCTGCHPTAEGNHVCEECHSE
ncbi:rRNA maturation endonuclease Nob1 [Luteibacter sp. Sphag1AF]|nr:rRNA maturation endonuclease Nob1 [Luteibacter sp. Sphag1AF]